MLTCIIRYQIDPTKKAQFNQYARNWGQAIPRCGADLIGYYAPHEGSSTLAYGIYNIPSLADYEAYRPALPLIRWAARTMNLPSSKSFSFAKTAPSSPLSHAPMETKNDRRHLRSHAPRR